MVPAAQVEWPTSADTPRYDADVLLAASTGFARRLEGHYYPSPS